MSNLFEISASEVDFCFKNPISHCQNPWHGAHGRVAEIHLKAWATQLLEQRIIEVPELYTFLHMLPAKSTELVKKSAKVDGTKHYNRACDGGFYKDQLRLVEVKFDTYDPLFPPKLTRKQLELCLSLREHKEPFILILGELRQEVRGQTSGIGEGIAVIDLNKFAHVMRDVQILTSRIKELVVNFESRLLI